MGTVWDRVSPVKSAADRETDARRVRGCTGNPLRVQVW